MVAAAPAAGRGRILRERAQESGAARSAGPTWPGPSCARAAVADLGDAFDRFLGRGPSRIRREDPARVRAVADAGACRRRTGIGGSFEGAGNPCVARTAQGAGSGRGGNPAPEPRSRSARATRPTSRSGSGCCAPAGATGTAIPSRESPTAPSALRTSPSNGSTGWTISGTGLSPRCPHDASRARESGSRFLRDQPRMADGISSVGCCEQSRVLLVFYPGNNTPG